MGGWSDNKHSVGGVWPDRETDRQSRTNDMGKSERQRESIKAAFAGPESSSVGDKDKWTRIGIAFTTIIVILITGRTE